MKKITRTVTGAVLATAAVTGLAVSAAAPAQAATYHVSLSKWSAYNYADSAGKIRHFDRTSSSTIFAPWAGRAQTSAQNACWGGVISYGFQY